MTVDTVPTESGLIARGALDGYAEAFAAVEAGVAIRALPLQRAYNLRVAPAAIDAVSAVLGVALPEVSRWSATASGGTVLWLGPDEWLLLDASGVSESSLRDAGAVVVEQSGQRVSVLIGGDAPGLLAKGTALDLHPAAFPVGSALQSFLGQTIVVFLARSGGEVEILVRSSFARYLGDWLLDAVRDPLAYPAV